MTTHAPRRATRLELLRARAAADRIELAQAVQDVSDRLATVRRVANSIGSMAALFSTRARMVGAVAAAGASVVRGVKNADVIGSLVARVRAALGPRFGLLALAAGAAIGAALLIRRRRRAPARGRDRDQAPQE